MNTTIKTGLAVVAIALGGTVYGQEQPKPTLERPVKREVKVKKAHGTATKKAEPVKKDPSVKQFAARKEEQ